MATNPDTTADSHEWTPLELATALGATKRDTDAQPTQVATDSSATGDTSTPDTSRPTGTDPAIGAIEPIPSVSRFPHTDSLTNWERAQYRNWTALVQAPVREMPLDARHLYKTASRVHDPPTTGQFEYVFFMVEVQHGMHYVVDAGTTLDFIPQFDAAAVKDTVSSTWQYYRRHAATTQRIADELEHLLIARHDLEADAFETVWIQQTLLVEFPVAPLPRELQPVSGAGPDEVTLAATLNLSFDSECSVDHSRDWSADDGWRPWRCH